MEGEALDMSDVKFDLTGRTIIVTGASSGMGAAIADAAGAAGALIVAVGRDLGRLSHTVDRIERVGGSAHPLAVDLLDDDAPREIVDQTCERFGGIHGIVHTAGVFWPKPFAETPVDELDTQWRTHVRAPFLLTQQALDQLRATRGSVVFFSSIFGTVGAPACSAYCSTKGGVSLLTQALAAELAHEGINVNCVAPGAIETPMNEQLRQNDPEFYATYRDAAPARRWGIVGDISGPTCFLLSSAADFIHGQVLHVDGGYVAQ